MRLDWWEEVSDLASSSNGFPFLGLRSRGLRGCVASPPPVVSNRRFWSRDVPASRFPLPPPPTSGQRGTPRREGTTLRCPFPLFAEAHELLLLRLVGWQCWFLNLPDHRFRRRLLLG